MFLFRLFLEADASKAIKKVKWNKDLVKFWILESIHSIGHILLLHQLFLHVAKIAPYFLSGKSNVKVIASVILALRHLTFS